MDASSNRSYRTSSAKKAVPKGKSLPVPGAGGLLIKQTARSRRSPLDEIILGPSRDAAADEEGHPCRATRCVVVPAEDAGEGFIGSRREPVLGACVVDELISFLELNRWTVSVKS